MPSFLVASFVVPEGSEMNYVKEAKLTQSNRKESKVVNLSLATLSCIFGVIPVGYGDRKLSTKQTTAHTYDGSS
jgi:hypothetical protein